MCPPAPRPGQPPARVGVLSPQPVVATGLRTLLERADGAWQVVSESEGPDGDAPPEVVLYDVLHLHAGDGADLDHLVGLGTSVVIAIGRELRPDLEAQALDRGARAAVSLGVSPGDLHDVVRDAIDGRLHESPVARTQDVELRLGHEVGLSRRESDVVRLIVQGHTNQEIAERLFLSVNSIKTYIRTAYRKIDADNRQQAVTWGVQHGFPMERDDPDTLAGAADG